MARNSLVSLGILLFLLSSAEIINIPFAIIISRFFVALLAFISSEKVNVISTDTNNITKVKEYYYKNDFELSYVNLYLSAKNLKDAVFSIHHQTLRVDIWTMTSGGNRTREFIPAGFCKDVKIDNMLDYIEGSK